MKKRIGNDIEQTVSVTLDGVAVDLGAVEDLAIVLKRRQAMSINVSPKYEIVGGNTLMYIEKEVLTEFGKYYYLITYKVPDTNFDDGYQHYTIDVDAFEVVARTAEEDDSDQQITVAAVAGLKGNGIESIDLTDTVGLVKTYTITYTDGTTTTFDVSDGADGHTPEITFVGTTIYVDGVAGADLQGEQGVQGEQGEQGVQGEQGIQGEQGETGASAYEIYLSETTDDPQLTINEWGNLMTGILNVLNSI